jgi:triosephosphate isomerase
MKKKIVIANWKMNNDIIETQKFFNVFLEKYNKNIEFLIAPSFPCLKIAKDMCSNTSIKIISQNMYYKDQGSFTGEVSLKILKSLNIDGVIIGHYERRKYFQENNILLYKKTKQALNNNTKIIFCIGENIQDRNKKEEYLKIKAQLDESLLININSHNIKLIYIAYEPVWAIGSSQKIDTQKIKYMYQYIHSYIQKYIKKNQQDKIPILYGGNVNINNIATINKIFDGVMIGRESIYADNLIKLTTNI